jgi:DNA polymerase IV
VPISSRTDLERLSITLLQNEMPAPKPVRLLSISLSAQQQVDDTEPQLALPM